MKQPKPRSENYNSLVTYIQKGKIVIPKFQRDFVWSIEDTAKLLDSILKGYPIGTFILWKTQERMQGIKKLGGSDLPAPPEGDQTEKYGLPVRESDLSITEFWNPTKERPMSAAEFLSHFNPSAATRILLGTYERHGVVKRRLPKRIGAFFLMLYKRFRYVSALHSHLKAEPEDALLIGYEMDEHGRINLDSYETLRQFINERVLPLLEEIIDAFLIELKSIMRSEGIPFGRNVSEDATFLMALRNDEEAQYNGFYEASGYKVDMIVDNENSIPLSVRVMDANESEGGCLPHALKHLDGLHLLPDIMYVDGGYTSYENIAISEARYRVKLRYRIERDWVINPRGFEENIGSIYQRHWKDSEFITSASIDYILRFLLDRGYEEEVGAYFRNTRMAEYEEAPGSYMDFYHRRNSIEGFNGYSKNHMNLERDIPRGKERVRIHALSRLCSIIVAALTRAQNGVFDNLGSVAYIK